MRLLFSTIFFFCFTFVYSQDIVDEYLERWKSFYPDHSLRLGIHEKVFEFADSSDKNIGQWLDYNRQVLYSIDTTETSEFHAYEINKRLLRNQVINEINKWEQKKPHQTSLNHYNNLFNQTLNRHGRAEFLTKSELNYLMLKSYQSISSNCTFLIYSLNTINDENPQASIETLKTILQKVKDENRAYKSNSNSMDILERMNQSREQAISEMEKVILHVEKLPQQPSSQILGRDEYARRLQLYTDSKLTPELLETQCLNEIQKTKALMLEASRNYLQSQYPDSLVAGNSDQVIMRALDDMEKDVVRNAEEYLDFWKELESKTYRFIEEHGIVSLPAHPTLRIMTAPESAGPAARIGWVDSAPPFDPNPVTTLYLPSIPDTLPLQEQVDFWASFNKPFNRMIVIHELIPGHYLQLKISRETPHPLRLIFPYGPYIEGWATFCEKIVLDAGWDVDMPLTYLAHLRKRLENANRAYTSVMVHCHGWTQDDVQKFSVETSLLAPQFAKSLWGRLMRSPMQITSYFYGGVLFNNLYKRETLRLGNRFDLKHFMDTIMKAGPIPIDEFDQIFSQL